MNHGKVVRNVTSDDDDDDDDAIFYKITDVTCSVKSQTNCVVSVKFTCCTTGEPCNE